MARPTSSSVPNSTPKCTSEPPALHSISETDHQIVTQVSLLTDALSAHHDHRIVDPAISSSRHQRSADSRGKEISKRLREESQWVADPIGREARESKTTLTIRRHRRLRGLAASIGLTPGRRVTPDNRTHQVPQPATGWSWNKPTRPCAAPRTRGFDARRQGHGPVGSKQPTGATHRGDSRHPRWTTCGSVLHSHPQSERPGPTCQPRSRQAITHRPHHEPLTHGGIDEHGRTPNATQCRRVSNGS
jgi:hypothetical protein